MNFNIYLAALLTLASTSTALADGRNLKIPPPVEKITPRKTTVPDPVVPVFEDKGSSQRPADPRGNQYINLNSGAGNSTGVPQEAKIQTTFCKYLIENLDKISQPIHSGISSVQFSSANSKHVYHLLGVSSHNRVDGKIPAFIYESTQGAFFVLKPNGSGTSVLHTIPSNVVIVDRANYINQGYWDETKDGQDPLCGQFVNLVRN